MTETKKNKLVSQKSNHIKEIGRLNRISGQIDGIKKMINGQRDCSDILVQLRSVRSAIRSVEANILKTHLLSCIDQSFSSDPERQQSAEEFKNFFCRFHE